MRPARSSSRAAFGLQFVPITAFAHHKQPTREPLRETMGTVARCRHHDLLEKGVDVGIHEISEGRDRAHDPVESRFALIADVFKLRQKLLEIASWQSTQQ